MAYRHMQSIGVILLLLLFSAASVAADEQRPDAKKKQFEAAQMLPLETKVLSKIHQTNQMEIEAGKLAMEKAVAEDVRDYGERLVRDHQMADQKVKDLAESEGIVLVQPKPQTPQEEKQVKQKKQAMQKLHKLEGEAFDQAYLKFMVKSHEQAIQTLSKVHEKLEDPEVRELVGNLIPILDQHLELARELKTQLQPVPRGASSPN